MIEETKKKKKNLFLLILKKIKISHILILIILLAGNSYAWFIYINNVSNSVDVHVRAWKIDFDDGTTPVTEVVDVVADNVYPGMVTFEKPINAHNYSEVSANVSFSILEATIMGTTYVTQEGRTDAGQAVQSGDLTSAALQQQLENDYPFTISFDLSSSTIQAENGVATYTVSISWPYESGDDDADTLWGTRAYEFKQAHPTESCISLKVKIYITQASS